MVSIGSLNNKALEMGSLRYGKYEVKITFIRPFQL